MADHRVIFRHFPCDRARCELRPGPTDVLTRTPHQEPFSASKCGKSVIERPRSEPDSGLFSSMGPAAEWISRPPWPPRRGAVHGRRQREPEVARRVTHGTDPLRKRRNG